MVTPVIETEIWLSGTEVPVAFWMVATMLSPPLPG